MTAFADDGTVNTGVMADMVGYLLDKGVDGFYIGGTTGEGIWLPLVERKRIAEVVLKTVDGRVPVIAHVGTQVIADAIALARHAAEHGAAGVSSVLPPLFASPQSLTAYYTTLAASVPETPFLSYLLNPNIDAVAFMKRLSHIPNLAGTKYTGPNMFELRQIIDLGAGKWTVFSGMDEETVYADMMGVNGNIGSTLNFMPGAYKEIGQLVSSGDLAGAQALQIRANKVTEALINVGFPGALKYVMSKLGFAGGNPVLPGFPLTNDEKAALDRALGETDYDELVAM
jgi:N-acetylneuraminate lyase